MTKIEMGLVVTIVLAIISGALFLGKIDGRLVAIENDKDYSSLKKDKQNAIIKINSVLKLGSDKLNKITNSIGDNVKISCTTVSKSSSVGEAATAEITATIPKGYILTGGGCYSNTIHRKIIQNYPSDARTWNCATRDHSYGSAGNATVYAIGCKIAVNTH